jgi:hypothetical protein
LIWIILPNEKAVPVRAATYIHAANNAYKDKAFPPGTRKRKSFGREIGGLPDVQPINDSAALRVGALLCAWGWAFRLRNEPIGHQRRYA